MSDLFDFQPQSTRYAVMGNPVKHSKSPQIHTLFAQQFDIQLEYTAIHVEIGGFDQAVSHFSADGGHGLNITVPFKLQAYQYADTLSERAQLAEAVNTLQFSRDGGCYGDNTDGAGLVRDLKQNLGISLRGKSILLVGAGGAVRGVLAPLIQESPDAILIANRTVEKARQLADVFSSKGPVAGTGLTRLSDCSYDVVINGTTSSLNNTLPGIPETCIGQQTCVYDMMYSTQPTLFMKWAMEKGAALSSDGLGMLVEQAAESFNLWHNQFPDTQPVISALRKR